MTDAWKQHHNLVRRFTRETEVRPDLVVTALATDRSVRLRVGEWSGNFMKKPGEKRDPEPRITTRNISTMRELAEAILVACDFVENANPDWASQTEIDR